MKSGFLRTIVCIFLSIPCFASEQDPSAVEDLTPDLIKIVAAFDSRNAKSNTVCNGRLTLTSGTAVTSSDVTAATSVYFTPYDGGNISLYASAVWSLVSFSEVSVAVPSNTATPFDIFGYNNSGTLALETLAWTNDTTRGTALTTQDGVSVKNGDATRRYLGTGRTTSVSGQTEDSASRRFLWNKCNRVPRKLLAQSSTASWTYGGGVWRAVNATTTTGVTRVEFVLGQQVEQMEMESFLPKVADTNWDAVASGVGIDSTTVNSADAFGGWSILSTDGGGYCIGPYIGTPAEGYHYGQWLEFYKSGGGASTRFGFSAAGFLQGAIAGQVWQ